MTNDNNNNLGQCRHSTLRITQQRERERDKDTHTHRHTQTHTSLSSRSQSAHTTAPKNSHSILISSANAALLIGSADVR